MLSVLPSTSDDVSQNDKSMDCTAPTSLFKLKHLEFFCGRIPIRIYHDVHSGVHYASIESPASNLTDVSVNYVTYPFPNGLPNVVANLVLTGTEKGLAADRFEYYLGNIFSPCSINVGVEQGHTAFSFNLIGSTSGSVQLLSLLLDSLSNVTFGQRDFNHQIFDSEDVAGKLYNQLQTEESCLQNTVDKARRSRSFHGSIFANDHIGTSDDLRKRCKMSKITQYFQSFYQDPWILLSGNALELDLNLLDTLLLKQSYATKYKRPNSKVANYAELIASSPISDVPFHYTDIVTVTGIYNAADKGILQIGFLADAPTNVTFIEAIGVLSEYLCGSETSHLNELLTSGNNSLCSSISIDLKVAPRCEVVVQLNDVPKYFLNKGAVEKLFDALGTVRWDLQQLHEIITRKIRHYNELTEDNISNEVFERLRYFQLYADSDDGLVLKRLLNPVLVLNELLQFSPVYWHNLTQRLFVENCAVVIGVPDNSPIQRHLLDPQLTPKQGNRDRRLRRSTELLREIYKPSDALFSQEIVDVASAPVFPFHQIFPITFKSFHWKITGSKASLLPEYFKTFKQFVDPSIPMSITVHPVAESEFVKTVFLFDVRSVELRLRYYILLFIKLLFNTASTVNGNFMSATELKRAMQNELLRYECKIGFDSNGCHILQLTFKALASKLEFVEKWFHAVMCNAVFDIKDVVEAVHWLIESGYKSRKDGVSFCNAMLNSINLKQDSEDFFLNELVLEPFYAEIMQSFMEGNYQHVMDNLQMLRNQLLNGKISLHLVGSPKKFVSTQPIQFEDLKRFCTSDKIEKITIDSKTHSGFKWPSTPEFHVIGAKEFRTTSDSVERIHVNCEPFDDVHAAILLFCQYFSTKGGIFWRCITEDGQAREAKFSFDIHRRTLTLTVTGAKNPKPTRQLIFYLLRQMFIESVDLDLFRVAQRSLAAQIVEKYATVESVGSVSIFNDINDWTVDQITSFVHKILVIKSSRCQLLLYDLIAQISAGKNLSAIVCPSYQVQHLMQSFQDILQPNILVKHRNDEQFGLLSG